MLLTQQYVLITYFYLYFVLYLFYAFHNNIIDSEKTIKIYCFRNNRFFFCLFVKMLLVGKMVEKVPST